MSLSDDLGARRVPEKDKTHVEVTSDGATISNALFSTNDPTFDDWAHIFKRFNLNPERFEIVDDTVRLSSWDQSSRGEGQERDYAQLYSFSARFRKAPEDRLDHTEIEEARKRIQAHKPSRKQSASKLKKSKSPVLLVSDFQLGKEIEGGIDEMVTRIQNATDDVDFWLGKVKRDYHVEEIALVNMGDLVEGCDGWYPNQLFTTLLNSRDQLNLAIDTVTNFAQHFFPQAERGQFITTLSNHGELGRTNGNKNRTDDADSADALIAETLERILSANSAYDHVSFVTPRDEMITHATVGGVKMAFAHGHKIRGGSEDAIVRWIEGQQRRSHEAWAADIWQLAHRHTFRAFDIGSAFVFQSPTMDGGSKSFTDSTGKYSRSGMLCYLADADAPLKHSGQVFV